MDTALFQPLEELYVEHMIYSRSPWSRRTKVQHQTSTHIQTFFQGCWDLFTATLVSLQSNCGGHKHLCTSIISHDFCSSTVTVNVFSQSDWLLQPKQQQLTLMCHSNPVLCESFIYGDCPVGSV